MRAPSGGDGADGPRGSAPAPDAAAGLAAARPAPARHALAWADLAGARVGVWGLGVEGRASLRRLQAMGVGAVVVDDRPASADVLATAEGGLEALAACEVVVKAPGISRYRPEVAALEAGGTAVVGGLGLWLHGADRTRVVCVTGTKGKSTTTTVLGHLLRRLGRRPFVGGNLGAPPFDPDAAAEVDGADCWVLEVSSYQATDLALAPAVVAVTSLHADHLPWHGDEATYHRDKLALCTLPWSPPDGGGGHLPGARTGPTVLANAADPGLRSAADLLGPSPTWVGVPDPPPPWMAGLGLLGAHNRANAALAAACLPLLGVDADDAALAAAAPGMAGLGSRLQPVGAVALPEGGEVRFVDDSLSTNVLPTTAALDAFADEPVALLAGGEDRGIDYAPLGAHLAGRQAPVLVLAMPTTGPRLAAAVRAALPAGSPVEVVEVADLVEGVRRGHAWAAERGGGVVLLSPAAPSFDRFRDYADRADAFTAAARELGATGR